MYIYNTFNTVSHFVVLIMRPLRLKDVFLQKLLASIAVEWSKKKKKKKKEEDFIGDVTVTGFPYTCNLPQCDLL